jgi:ABC-type cobalamin transport system permease subunit
VSDLECYLAALRAPNPLDPDQRRPLAAVSIRSARYALLRAATFLVGSGVPIEKVTSLATLVAPEAFRTTALEMHRDGLPRLRAANETA